VNREERRRDEKAQQQQRLAAMRNANPAVYFSQKCRVIDDISRNGITPDALKREYDRGRDDGGREVTQSIGTIYTAAMCLALHEMHGFGRERLYRLMGRMNEIMLETLTAQEAIQKVYKKLGLKFRQDDPFNWLDFDD